MSEEEFYSKPQVPIAVVFKIIQEKSKEKKCFCIYEWQDSDYYYPIIDTINNNKYELVNYYWESKKSVISIYNLLKSYKININKLLFIDKDFDDNSKINTKDIYITKWYSIENYYTSESTFKKICKNNLYCDDKKLITNFNKRKTEFHKLIEIFNKIWKFSNLHWLWIEMKSLKITDYIDISYNKIKFKRGIKFSNIERILSNKIDWGVWLNFTEINTINFADKHYDYRWKYELFFVFTLLACTKEYVLKNNMKKTSFKIKWTNDLKCFLDTFSKYAEVPIELKQYIESKIL